MPSVHDLALPPDARYLKFREDYTTQEHLLALHDNVVHLGHVGVAATNLIHDDLQRASAANAAGLSAVSSGVEKLGGQVQEMSWAIEDGFANMARGQAEIARITQNGFESLSHTLDHRSQVKPACLVKSGEEWCSYAACLLLLVLARRAGAPSGTRGPFNTTAPSGSTACRSLPK